MAVYLDDDGNVQHVVFDEAKAAEQKEKLLAWKKKNHIKKECKPTSPLWARLTNHHMTLQTEYGVPADFLDHIAIYEDDNGKRVLTSQPYNDAGLKPDIYMLMNKEIKTWCAERGLSVRANKEESWYYPCRTILLEFRIADPEKYNEALQKIKR